MSNIEKNRVFNHIMRKQQLVRVTKIVDGDMGLPTIVVFRAVYPDFSVLLNAVDLGFEFDKKSKERYTTLSVFEKEYEWFVVDEETLFKIKSGMYERG